MFCMQIYYTCLEHNYHLNNLSLRLHYVAYITNG